jgi:zinc transport system ATP-binding protein
MILGKVVEFKHIRYCYGSVCALADVSFAVPTCSLTALVGPNGGGKSTLIKLLAGLLRPEAGEVIRNGDVGYVPQSVAFDLSFPLTVHDMVLMGTLDRQIKPFFRYGKAHREAAALAIRRVGLTGFEHRGIGQLSGGQLGRAVIARVLASSAAVIALDEPDASLDIDATKEFYAMLKALKAEKTILIASHHVDVVLDIADSALFVNNTVTRWEPAALKEKLKGGMAL